ncbi:ATP-binding protein [Meiothermus sp. CFH 77666]|uniref:Lon protease family protein n=1 Tax=Meiothermus sp. CFH 77666 TaxID=2817942 RepID=UPI001AA0A970|nr:ATP-binding protein [Meiothermus sp. CFH 77666]MBO1437852.1 AAA family ATPase [Meiothermus sp. CFH 77666]
MPEPQALQANLLPVASLRKTCDASQFDFRTTAELKPLLEFPGQTRAIQAVQFGLKMPHEGYNLFALGPMGVGKQSLVRHFTQAQAQQEPPAPDWVYVHNFLEPHKPQALRLPAGRGAELKERMERLVEELRVAIPAAFESEDYRTRRQIIDEEFKQKQQASFDALQAEANQQGIAIIRTPMGMGLAPVREREIITPEAFEQLPEEEQKRIQEAMEALHQKLQAILQQAPQWESERRQKIRELNREVTRHAIAHLLNGVREPYHDLAEVQSYLEVVEQDLIENAGQFLANPSESENPLEAALGKMLADSRSFDRYRVNLLVDNAGSQGAPVVEEDHPALSNLLGRIEYRAQLGNLVTDFTLIRPGALHRANGGYLILDARRVLLQPYAWEELKRALRAKEIQIRSVSDVLGLSSTVTLQPAPIPLRVKVILLGDRLLYYLLSAYDPDFLELFKVAADFEEALERTPEGEQAYARLIASLAQREQLRPLDKEAVARVIEHGSRLAADAHKVSAALEALLDLLREADHWAAQAQHEVITAQDIEQAIAQQIYRASRVQERLQEAVRRGTLLVDTSGARVGQINGLSVLNLGGYSFGHPTRITARVRLGKGEVVDIEREVELGGPLHSKGVLILAGFLGERYARERPLSLSASLVFEQSYSGVEGDSASMAELCAILSALAQVPIRQGIAITGSVNQHGQAQPIGGVNEKIEGFFEVCRDAGLNGEQGVIIPRANVQHLMLRPEVVEAVARGQFRVWAVDSVDEALSILTGLEAGERGADGRFPEGSLNARVEAQLMAFAEQVRAFAAPPAGGNP